MTVETESKQASCPHWIIFSRLKLASLTLESGNQRGMQTAFSSPLTSKAHPTLPVTSPRQASLCIQYKTTSLRGLLGLTFYGGKKKVHICKIKFWRLPNYFCECACPPVCECGEQGSSEWMCKEWMTSAMNALPTKSQCLGLVGAGKAFWSKQKYL